MLNLKSDVIHMSTKGERLSEKENKQTKTSYKSQIGLNAGLLSFSFQDKLDKVHCRNFALPLSPSLPVM